jgi:hypothetical protein
MVAEPESGSSLKLSSAGGAEGVGTAEGSDPAAVLARSGGVALSFVPYIAKAMRAAFIQRVPSSSMMQPTIMPWTVQARKSRMFSGELRGGMA